ncbi:hypothetical protein BKE38_06560 [Pseudoroseomonas deserti]|uniref:Uncharacterized protein n=1 Tax=Teichococcus deserti TaxID=1817963 RepID=A0A1V2H5P6_9PROT|nr:hypothetical protein [Pseudoroseomonas deserti]ONG56163.1 hypothetical protein BKE38_06560 [Pseudoroseomonas deserti]
MPDALPSPLPRRHDMAAPMTAYRPVAGGPGDGGGWRAAPLRPLARQWSRATAPFLARAPLFPWRLGWTARRLGSGQAGALPLAHAERYFGTRLRLELDPARLRWQLMDTVTDGRRTLRLAQLFLDGGDWSAAREPLAGSVVQQEMAALMDDGRPLQDSPIYRYMLSRIDEGRPEQRNAVRLATPALVDAYFAHYRALAGRIRSEGFLARDALDRRFAASPLRSAAIERREGEVGIAIGPDGEILRLLGGRHRTALAQLLRLPRMPVRVRLVHARWLLAEMDRHALPAPQALLAGLHRLAG